MASIYPTVDNHQPSAHAAENSAFAMLLRIAPTFVLIAILWSVSSWGYYALVDTFGLENGYDDAPVRFAGFYLVWAAIAFYLFRSTLSGRFSRPAVLSSAVAFAPILMAYAAFIYFVLPLLPEVSIYRAPPNPPEFMFASAWYYLPKSADILFQQILVAVMVFRAHAVGLSLRAIAFLMAVLFGGFHLTLAFDGFTALYVSRFTIAASLSGLLVPYLYLRKRHGLRWAYGLHWGFYAVDATVTHLVLAVPAWEM